MNKISFSVFEINNYIKSLFKEDFVLNNICIHGEISDLKVHSSGHAYFVLKDSKATINCVMFSSYFLKVPFDLEIGLKVLVSGYVSVYEKTGQYQVYVKDIEPSGKGSLHLAYEQLKYKLELEGLFDAKFKQKIPKYVKTVGVITSPTGAVIQDIISVSKRRNKNINLILAPTTVQGEQAGSQIVEAIELLNKYKKCDVIILCRGGGSIEDLWCFNQEQVARSIFKSKIPIISAVGHETDFTIADFVADLRASTPSVAAEIAVFNLQEVKSIISNLNNNLIKSLDKKINLYKKNINYLTDSITKYDIFHLINIKRQYLNKFYINLNKNIFLNIDLKRKMLSNKVLLIEAVSPMAILKKGYTIIEDSDGNLIKDFKNINLDDEIIVRSSTGTLKVKVINKV